MKKDAPVLNSNLDEPQPFYTRELVDTSSSSHHAPLPQCQVRRPWPRTQALGCTADDNGDRLASTLLEDIRARLLADGADAQRKQDLAVDRHVEVRRQREQVRDDTWELGREAGCWMGVGGSGNTSSTRGAGRTFCGECAHRAPGVGFSFLLRGCAYMDTYIPMIPGHTVNFNNVASRNACTHRVGDTQTHTAYPPADHTSNKSLSTPADFL